MPFTKLHAKYAIIGTALDLALSASTKTIGTKSEVCDGLMLAAELGGLFFFPNDEPKTTQSIRSVLFGLMTPLLSRVLLEVAIAPDEEYSYFPNILVLAAAAVGLAATYAVDVCQNRAKASENMAADIATSPSSYLLEDATPSLSASSTDARENTGTIVFLPGSFVRANEVEQTPEPV